MADEISSLGKDVNKGLYEEDRASRIAREMGYRGGEVAADIIKEIREDYLKATSNSDVATVETDEFVDNGLNTSTTDNDNALNTLTDVETNEAIVVDDNTDNIDVNSNPVITSVEATEDMPNSSLDNVKENKLKTFVFDEQGQGVSTGQGNNTDKVLLATGVVGKGLKVARKTAKVGGGLIRFGKNFNIYDAQGNVDSTKASGDQIKTAVKFVGRKTSKYANKAAMAGSKKIMNKTVYKVSQKVATTTTKYSVKISTKLSAEGMKGLAKISKFVIEFVGKLIAKIITVIIEAAPVMLAVLLIVVLAVGVFSIFAPFADKGTMDKFATHINNTQSDFYDKVKSYYDDDYIVTGTYNGEAYIDWRGALSVVQGLNANIDGSNGEIWLLKQMENDGVMYSIDKVSCTPYYRHQTKKYATITGLPQYDVINSTVIGVDYNVVFSITPNYDYVADTYTPCPELSNMSHTTISNSGIYYYKYYSNDTNNNSGKYWATYTEGVYTDYMYQVTVGSLDDYKNWIINNPDIIKTFYDKEGVNYDTNTSNFLTAEVEEIMDSLYSSDSFDMGFIGCDTKLSAQAVAGQVYDTGEHKGVLAYPTSSRTISATFPYYSNGTEHTGIDFPVPMGTPICACYDGEVIVVKKLNYSYGYYVVIKHKLEDGAVIYTLYAHNSALFVNEGDKVVQGQVIAKSGSTGNSTGPHCHLSVLTSWSPQIYVQPLDYL